MVYSISELTERFHISSRTLRYYEEEGLLHSEVRQERKIRYFNQDNIERLKIILALREIDIPLGSIRRFLDGECSLKDTLNQQRRVLESQMNYLYDCQSKLEVLLEKAGNNERIQWENPLKEQTYEKEENRLLARACIDEFLEDKYELFFQHASEVLKRHTSYEVFANIWRETICGLGECINVEEQNSFLPGCFFVLQFESISVTVRFVFGEREIQGFWLEYKENGNHKGIRLRC